ncbi:hypothetical protein Y032_0043g738 [Ancylostoma ceylanicum]|uniref:RNA-directed DNA polymerase n=1 Tax=Ancylostoma ceylanicum TaxID=53326 RepID=A0A016UFV9_9BILA|nr:hypothetical protein Y032_0043g738 [Ancylostoma ceylanicum]
MHTVLGPLLGEEVFCCLDDIIIATDTAEKHLQMLEKVFNALQGAGLKLNPRKCVLLEKKVEFLGHVIDREGLHMDPSKVEAIVNYPLPQSRSELRTFLGMYSYYRKFVLGFAKVAAPLHELTSEKTKFEWTTERRACFDQLKRIITQAPVLAQPDIEGARSGKKPFRIHTDASYLGLGAVLSQEGDDGLIHPIFFASKGLTNCEKRYQCDRLGSARRRFCPQEVPHRTNVSARVLRWALELQKYNLKMIYLKGAANRVADALSRGATSPQDSHFEESIPNELIVASTTEASDWTRTSRTYSVADFVINRGFLTLVENDQLRRIVPPSKRKDVFNEAHHGMLAGHFGAKKILRELSKRLFWESMRRDIILWTEECRDCFCHNGRRDMVPPLKPIVTTKPFELVGVDILEMGPTTEGNRYILAVVDHFSKFAGAYAIPSKSASTVAKVFFERWVADGGRQPKCILSDQGGEFDNKLMNELRALMGIEHVFTKGYNPRENGLTERFNETLIHMLRKKVRVPTEWDKILSACVFAYNTTVHQSTGESPFFLLHGFDAHVPWDLAEREVSMYAVDMDSYLQELTIGTQIAREYAQEVNSKMRDRMKTAYDREKRICVDPPKVGDRVYMKIPGEKQSSRNPKLVNPWEGPYRMSQSALRKAEEKEAALEKLLRMSVYKPLNLRYRCTCGLFGQMAYVAIPGLKHPMARSKKVLDMYQLANVASISEQQCWGDERKEMELRKKNSPYLTPYGLALAMDAHRRRCHGYAERLDAAKRMRFEHPAVFPWPVDFNVGDYITMAISMLDHVEAPCLTNNTDHDVFIALPSSFSQVNAGVAYEDNVNIYVYADFSTLAEKLMKTQITRSIVVVWPDRMPESRPMRQLLISLERHLQCGGTLAFFPSPYEDRNEFEWKRIGEVCTEFVRYITQPSRQFDALVRDHYGDVLEQSPHTHPATCLGTDPRRKRERNSPTIRFFSSSRRCGLPSMTSSDFQSSISSTELKDKKRQDKMAKAKRRRDEMRPNFFVIEDPHRQRHTCSISFEEPRAPRREKTPPRGTPFENPAKRDRRRDSVPPRTDDRLNRGHDERPSKDRDGRHRMRSPRRRHTQGRRN